MAVSGLRWFGFFWFLDHGLLVRTHESYNHGLLEISHGHNYHLLEKNLLKKGHGNNDQVLKISHGIYDHLLIYMVYS